jgi:RNA polymerase sigma-70 factor (ECF subfamily)
MRPQPVSRTGKHDGMAVNSANDDHSELVERALDGDAEAFGDLYELYLDEIYRYIYFRVAEQAEAEDLTEMVFLKAWEALPESTEPMDDIRAWLYRVAHNLVIDRHRTRKPTVPLEDTLTPSDHATPEGAALTLDASRELAHKIGQLKPILQQVLLCRFVSDMSHAETARTMGLREGHVRVLQYRALKEIRRLLAEDGDGQ